MTTDHPMPAGGPISVERTPIALQGRTGRNGARSDPIRRHNVWVPSPIRFAVLPIVVVTGACSGAGIERNVNPAPTAASTTTTTRPAPTSAASPTTAILLPADATSLPPTVELPTVPSTAPGTSAPAPTPAPTPATLTLRGDGLGEMAFGSEAETVIAYVSGILGPPTSDSGWLSAFDSPFGVCPGEEVRGLTWGDLLLLFGDETIVAAGQRHLYSYIYGPGDSPAGLVTAQGIGLGTTVAALRAAYPDTEVYSDEFLGVGFQARSARLAGGLSDTGDAGTVLSISGGDGCGE